ncbi:MAG: STAS domain-containing protein [Bacteroidales bacterium]
MTEKNDTGTLVLGPVQTLRTIEETREVLSRHLTGSGNIHIDCAPVEEADISIVQVLLSVRATAERLGVSLRLTAPSAPLVAVLERAGVPPAAIDPAWNGEAA